MAVVCSTNAVLHYLAASRRQPVIIAHRHLERIPAAAVRATYGGWGANVSRPDLQSRAGGRSACAFKRSARQRLLPPVHDDQRGRSDRAASSKVPCGSRAPDQDGDSGPVQRSAVSPCHLPLKWELSPAGWRGKRLPAEKNGHPTAGRVFDRRNSASMRSWNDRISAPANVIVNPLRMGRREAPARAGDALAHVGPDPARAGLYSRGGLITT